MARLQIPLRADLDNYEFNIDLDGVAYRFEVVWNGRANQWSLIIKDDGATVIVGAIPLVINSDLLGRFKLKTLPQGLLFLFDTSLSNQEANKEDLGSRCVLLYDEAI